MEMDNKIFAVLADFMENLVPPSKQGEAAEAHGNPANNTHKHLKVCGGGSRQKVDPPPELESNTDLERYVMDLWSEMEGEASLREAQELPDSSSQEADFLPQGRSVHAVYAEAPQASPDSTPMEAEFGGGLCQAEALLGLEAPPPYPSMVQLEAEYGGHRHLGAGGLNGMNPAPLKMAPPPMKTAPNFPIGLPSYNMHQQQPMGGTGGDVMYKKYLPPPAPSIGAGPGYGGCHQAFGNLGGANPVFSSIEAPPLPAPPYPMAPPPGCGPPPPMAAPGHPAPPHHWGQAMQPSGFHYNHGPPPNQAQNMWQPQLPPVQEIKLTAVGVVNGEVVYGLPPGATFTPYTQTKKTTSKPQRQEPEGPYVKKPPNAFMLYLSEQRPHVLTEMKSTVNPTVNSNKINSILGAKWKLMSKDEQDKYYEMAKREKDVHIQLYPGWKPCDNYGKKRKRSRTKLKKICDASGFDSHDFNQSAKWQCLSPVHPSMMGPPPPHMGNNDNLHNYIPPNHIHLNHNQPNPTPPNYTSLNPTTNHPMVTNPTLPSNDRPNHLNPTLPHHIPLNPTPPNYTTLNPTNNFELPNNDLPNHLNPALPNPTPPSYTPLNPALPNPTPPSYTPLNPALPNPTRPTYTPLNPALPNPTPPSYTPLNPVLPNHLDSSLSNLTPPNYTPLNYTLPNNDLHNHLHSNPPSYTPPNPPNPTNPLNPTNPPNPVLPNNDPSNHFALNSNPPSYTPLHPTVPNPTLPNDPSNHFALNSHPPNPTPPSFTTNPSPNISTLSKHIGLAPPQLHPAPPSYSATHPLPNLHSSPDRDPPGRLAPAPPSPDLPVPSQTALNLVRPHPASPDLPPPDLTPPTLVRPHPVSTPMSPNRSPRGVTSDCSNMLRFST